MEFLFVNNEKNQKKKNKISERFLLFPVPPVRWASEREYLLIVRIVFVCFFHVKDVTIFGNVAH